MIVELKRGGFTISHGEKDQAMQYARQIRRSGKVTSATKITCYVLGASVEPDAGGVLTDDNITVYPRTYQIVLRQAHARTFHLHQQISLVKPIEYEDKELEEVISRVNLEMDLNAFEGV